MAEHNKLGAKGEEIAKKYLQQKGFQIIDQNWRFGNNDEIDLIALDGDELVFIEVKTRSSNEFGEPEEFVNRKKQRFIVRAANFYIDKKDIDKEVRFDVVAIILNPFEENIRHIQDAFSPFI